ncbi:MAG: hypothetical protein A3D37_00870 [Candidatus Zambryskibacteria bacterium RIFCSPHIGHO2_02_FULL_38_22]|uniref:Uncharacterized protein n=1 Tax=Candidatus Zambryskibacteria bacterium RIFCSPLOWO2_12_FULL_39_16 TaxID=1802775 RepID=A0A1G2UTQ1_9BACT|nr:MAG: hypothetical protein A3D37_00870 [Candidatus Zambryskibacteria bacterium RIFCSPHIGHO2_02_FULL_38_22]OHB09139.1 MAG: hypothetical protein A3I19_02990 [Candidatus Zambryskibacteria bacterium RIFCSPLOWO2_02_FULL_38_13]OHB12771.1 MAG: hypothetical protein A3G46_02935 [Candidatus Zambryskibacteria bacterium RIFCSPLOWO2_12_FULL_39_16]
MKKFLGGIFGWIVPIVLIGCVAVMFGLILSVLQPLWPITTLIFVVVLTVHTFERKLLGFASICGIVVYALSWPITGRYGQLIGLAVCATGFLIWFWSVCQSFQRPAYAKT